MIFQRKVDRAMHYQKERNEQAEVKKPTEEDKDKVSKKDVLAMILSAIFSAVITSPSLHVVGVYAIFTHSLFILIFRLLPFRFSPCLSRRDLQGVLFPRFVLVR